METPPHPRHRHHTWQMYPCAYPITSWGKFWLKPELLLDYTSHFPCGEPPIMANMSKWEDSQYQILLMLKVIPSQVSNASIIKQQNKISIFVSPRKLHFIKMSLKDSFKRLNIKRKLARDCYRISAISVLVSDQFVGQAKRNRSNNTEDNTL